MNATGRCPRCGGARSGAVCPHCVLAAAIDPGLARDAQSPCDASAIGGYHLCGEIARGGNGVVYRAWQPELKREVALKMLLSVRRDHPDALTRFRREAALMARIEAPGILPVYDIGEQDGLPYFCMKLAVGGNLAERVAVMRGDFTACARLLAAVARAVARAHARGVLHRDLKPSNIVFDENDEPQVTDFGLARHLGADASLTGTDALIGTPRYVAPELVTSASAALAPAADIYGLGAILYELLTGVPPFSELTPLQVLRDVATRAPVRPRTRNPAIPVALETICLRCLEKRPGDRYASADDLARALEDWLAEAETPTRRHLPPMFTMLPSRRRRVTFATALLLLVGIAALSSWYASREPIAIPDAALATNSVVILPNLLKHDAREEMASRRIAERLRLPSPLRLRPFDAALAKARSLPIGADTDLNAVLGAFIVVVVVEEPDDATRLALAAIDDLREESLYETTFATGDEDRVAQDLAAALHARRATPTPEAQLSRRALAAFLRARRLLEYPTSGTNDDAIAALKETIRLAPDSALAHAWLAEAYNRHNGEAYWMDTAIDEAARARRMDPSLGLASAQLGQAYYRKSWMSRATAAYEQARRLGSMYLEEPLSLIYYETGRFNDSYRLARERLRYGTDHIGPLETIAHVLFAVGENDRGERQLRQAMVGMSVAERKLREAEIALYRQDYAMCSRLAAALEPLAYDGRFARHTLLARCAAQQGDYAAALATLPAIHKNAVDSGRLNGNPPELQEAILLAQTQSTQQVSTLVRQAQQALQAALDAGNDLPKVWLRMAAAQRLAGDTDAAYATLERAFALGLTYNNRTRAMLEFLPFRGDDRFAALRDKSIVGVAVQREAILRQIPPDSMAAATAM
ncbi:MAG: protein kinase [Proteobacteria bacterium]|nr:protein kinase [Pseudomonadota bacterium]